MLIKNKMGTSLVEVTIAMGLVVAISAAVMKLMDNFGKSTAKLEFDSDITLTVNEIYALLADPIRCKMTFSDTNGGTKPLQIASSVIESTPPEEEEETEEAPPEGEEEQAVNTQPTYIVQSYKYISHGDYDPTKSRGKNTYGNSNFSINSYELVETGSNTDAFLQIRFNRKRVLQNKSGGNATLVKKVNMYVERDATTNELVLCRSLSSADTDIWSRGEGSSIYYLGGNVAIGTEEPNSSELYIKGAARATTFVYDSDVRLKRDVETIDNPLEKLNMLRGVSFNWIEDGHSDLGLIAQDVQKVLPELVVKDQQRDVLTVDYAKMVPLLIEAIKQQQKEINMLKKSNKSNL